MHLDASRYPIACWRSKPVLEMFCTWQRQKSNTKHYRWSVKPIMVLPGWGQSHATGSTPCTSETQAACLSQIHQLILTWVGSETTSTDIGRFAHHVLSSLSLPKVVEISSKASKGFKEPQRPQKHVSTHQEWILVAGKPCPKEKHTFSPSDHLWKASCNQFLSYL